MTEDRGDWVVDTEGNLTPPGGDGVKPPTDEFGRDDPASIERERRRREREQRRGKSKKPRKVAKAPKQTRARKAAAPPAEPAAARHQPSPPRLRHPSRNLRDAPSGSGSAETEMGAILGLPGPVVGRTRAAVSSRSAWSSSASWSRGF